MLSRGGFIGKPWGAVTSLFAPTLLLGVFVCWGSGCSTSCLCLTASCSRVGNTEWDGTIFHSLTAASLTHGLASLWWSICKLYLSYFLMHEIILFVWHGHTGTSTRLLCCVPFFEWESRARKSEMQRSSCRIKMQPQFCGSPVPFPPL